MTRQSLERSGAECSATASGSARIESDRPRQHSIYVTVSADVLVSSPQKLRNSVMKTIFYWIKVSQTRFPKLSKHNHRNAVAPSAAQQRAVYALQRALSQIGPGNAASTLHEPIQSDGPNEKQPFPPHTSHRGPSDAKKSSYHLSCSRPQPVGSAQRRGLRVDLQKALRSMRPFAITLQRLKVRGCFCFCLVF